VQRDLERRIDRALTLEIEPGRYLVAEAGLLLTEVRAVKRAGPTDFVMVDAGFHNLPRPVLYGAYHEIQALGVRRDEPRFPQIVAGPLCESTDLFSQDAEGRPEARLLPRLVPGDFLCVRDAGAYAASMASNYNTQPFAAEVLVDGPEARVVARRQALPELWARELAF
jgi:diaminopimelate decarboxylase